MCSCTSCMCLHTMLLILASETEPNCQNHTTKTTKFSREHERGSSFLNLMCGKCTCTGPTSLMIVWTHKTPSYNHESLSRFVNPLTFGSCITNSSMASEPEVCAERNQLYWDEKTMTTHGHDVTSSADITKKLTYSPSSNAEVTMY